MKINIFNKYKNYKHKGVVGFEYVIILIIMSVALFGTFNVLSNTLKTKGNELATFINYNGQYGLGIDPDEIEKKYVGFKMKWIGDSEIMYVRPAKDYFNAMYKYNRPEYIYGWKCSDREWMYETFTSKDHLMRITGKDGSDYYIINPEYEKGTSHFKNTTKYKLNDII